MGVGSSFYEASYLNRFLMWLIIGSCCKDKETQEKVTFEAAAGAPSQNETNEENNVRITNMVIVRPGALMDWDARGPEKYKLGPHSGGLVSRLDVAGLLIRLVEEESLFDTWKGKAVTVAY
jgi:hypothetical protein